MRGARTPLLLLTAADAADRYATCATAAEDALAADELAGVTSAIDDLHTRTERQLTSVIAR
jgi:hypothetical protein